MKRSRLGQKGFTLMEIIVVLAVIGALSAVLVPVVFRYIDDARRGQAQSDANVVAAAINQMYKDTGRWPFYASGTSAALKYTLGTDYAFLTSNTTITGGVLSGDATVPAVGSATGWDTALKADSLENHLIKNTPAYATSSGRVWKGPYVDKIPLVDPWGRSYLVNIANADPGSETPGTQKWTIVISSGPNGTLETNGGTTATSSPAVGGDDILARVK